MQNNQLPYDTSFVHTYNWRSPDRDITIALQIITGCREECPASSESNQDVSSVLAANPETPSAVLNHLAVCCKHIRILETIAGNCSTALETLQRLARHEASEVRRAVAENAKLDDKLLDELLSDSHIDVRYTLAENHSLPVEVLKVLCEDDNPYVASRADRTLKRVLEQLQQRGQSAQLPQRPKIVRKEAV
jgi:hypothetical protein